MKTKDFAKVILRAAEIREDSFDHKKANKIDRDSFPDYRQCYKMSMNESADKAVEELNLNPRMSQPIFLLLYCSWNDSTAWAEEIMED